MNSPKSVTEIKPYSQEGSKKNQVSKMFDNIAPWYDFLNHFLSLGIDVLWRKRAIRMLSSHHPKLVLDVATGTADVAIETAKQLAPGKVIGVDIAGEMLEIGREKIAKRHLEKVIELRLADSENLPFPDNSFDAVTVAFGVRNFENLEKGLTEMLRVLKPNGKLVVLEFSKPTIFPFRQLFNFYFKTILPVIGRLTSKDRKAYSYLYESVQAFPDGKNFASLLETVGFQSTTIYPLTLGISTVYFAEKKNN